MRDACTGKEEDILSSIQIRVVRLNNLRFKAVFDCCLTACRPLVRVLACRVLVQVARRRVRCAADFLWQQ